MGLFIFIIFFVTDLFLIRYLKKEFKCDEDDITTKPKCQDKESYDEKDLDNDFQNMDLNEKE